MDALTEELSTRSCPSCWLELRERIHLVVDNYVIHKSRLTERALRDLGGRIVLHFLPPYCPDHNRIERVWLDLHANVTRNHRCTTLNALLANARVFLNAYRWRNEVRQPLLRIAAWAFPNLDR